MSLVFLYSVLALTVKISGSPGDQIFSLTFRNSISKFLNSHLWSKTVTVKLSNT